MKRLLFSFVFLVLSISLTAQGYNVAAGLRMGTDWGITGKYRIEKRLSVEGILQSSFGNDGIILTALVEKHAPLITKRFNFYTGIGLHKGWNNNLEQEIIIKDPFGLTAIAGIEFNLGKTNISWDFKPAFNIIGGQRTMYTQTGVSLRYVFVKRPWFKKKKKKKFNWKFWKKK